MMVHFASVAGAFMVLSGTTYASSVDIRDACSSVDLFMGEQCAKTMQANGEWTKEFILSGKSMDSGTDYEIWRKGREAVLCARQWTRGQSNLSTKCALLNQVPVKN